MTKREDVLRELDPDWGQIGRDVRQGLQPSTIEGNLNSLAMGLLNAPRNLYEAARHPVNAIHRLLSKTKEGSANSLRLLHQMSDPNETPALRQQARDEWLRLAAPVMAGVIKEPGGNWLSGGVERALRPLKTNLNNAPAYQAAIERDLAAGHYEPNSPNHQAALASLNRAKVGDALNDWVDKKLTKYIKNDMGTERDPVRALAEQGILHVPPEQLNYSPRFHGDPRYMGPGVRHVAQAVPAKAWEGAADLTIHPSIARQFQQIPGPESAADQGWLGKLSPETPVYSPAEPASLRHDLGFNHLVDELRNAVRPDSDLPRELRLTPEQLGRTNVPDAVRLVHKINQWREKAKSEANLQLAKNPATHVLKQYDTVPGTQTPNVKGLHWVELKQPEGVEVDPIAPNRELESALKYEGDQMGHCVGGYCPDVQEGRSRIFSLRDAKGQPHVTVETSPPTVEPRLSGDVSFPGRIVQIKGKANRAPTPEYLPFVQDFVRTQGPWNDVGDFGNTGMVVAGYHPVQLFGNEWTPELALRYEQAVKSGALPAGSFITKQDILDAVNQPTPGQ